MEAAGLHPIREHIRRPQASIAEKVALGSIYELCTGVGRIPGTSSVMIWWYQDVVNEPEEYTEIMCTLT